MAAGSLLLLLDDITAMMDDVALMTKVAAAKTSAVLGDDLALNANQLSGLSADRELQVVWRVALGSLRNKVVLVPAAILLSIFAPWLVLPLLIVGGTYLCLEGAEKIVHHFFRGAAHDGESAPLAERDRVAGAIRTDFILSAEIIVIALGTVETAPLHDRIGVLIAVAILMTLGVYGAVALIVKSDDVGIYLYRTARTGLGRSIGLALIHAAPLLMRVLAVGGTLAMFTVGGGIITHGIGPLDEGLSGMAHALTAIAGGGPVVSFIAGLIARAIAGLVIGMVALGAVTAATRITRAVRS